MRPDNGPHGRLSDLISQQLNRQWNQHDCGVQRKKPSQICGWPCVSLDCVMKPEQDPALDYRGRKDHRKTFAV